MTKLSILVGGLPALLFIPAGLHAQTDIQPDAEAVARGKNIFTQSCAGCHGADTFGTDRAPGLSGNRRVRARNIEQLRNLISHGIPATGMPAFNLAPQDLEAIVAFVHSLNSSAYETPVLGSAEAGKEIFFGSAGHCGTCHMVNGRGSDTGPDLSNAGREMTVQEIEGALLQPDSRITPGYELVTVHLRDGASVRGFVRGMTNFDVQLQDLDGKFHLVHSHEILSVAKEKRSLMKPWSGTPAQLRDVVAYLSRLAGVTEANAKAGFDIPPSRPGDIDFARIETLNPAIGLPITAISKAIALAR